MSQSLIMVKLSPIRQRVICCRHHTVTFVCDLASPITSVPTIEGYECVLADSMTLEVEVDKGQSLNEVFVSLSAHDVSVVSMRTKTNRLEELFVTMTSGGTQ